MQRVQRNNISTSLLYEEENEQLFELIGVRCQSLATTVAQLYTTEPPNHSQWIKTDTGVLCFVKDNYRKNYFLRLYCLTRNTLIWEHEMYHNMEYFSPSEFFHTFEGEGRMVAFNFANITEAKELKAAVEKKILIRRLREEKRQSRNIYQDQSLRLPVLNDVTMNKKVSDSAKRKAKGILRKITKSDIGKPCEFRHISHVGWDPDNGFDINSNDPKLNTFFKKAGVSEKQLQDRSTREFIYNFINENGGREAVHEVAQNSKKTAPAPPLIIGPPVPPRSPNQPHSKAAPTPLFSSTPQIPRSPQTPNTLSLGTSTIPPPPVGIVPPPPPLPPPLEMPVAAAPLAVTGTRSPAPDMRSALMESIRGGNTLKPVETEKKSKADGNDSSGDLMNEIRKGFQLKSCSERELKPVSPLSEQSRGDLAGALARALNERNRVIQSDDDSTSDTDSNEEDWGA